jgi:hypothetical protein
VCEGGLGADSKAHGLDLARRMRLGKDEHDSGCRPVVVVKGVGNVRPESHM